MLQSLQSPSVPIEEFLRLTLENGSALGFLGIAQGAAKAQTEGTNAFAPKLVHPRKTLLPRHRLLFSFHFVFRFPFVFDFFLHRWLSHEKTPNPYRIFILMRLLPLQRRIMA